MAGSSAAGLVTAMEVATTPSFHWLSRSVSYDKVLRRGNMIFSIYSVWIGRLDSLFLN